MRGYSGCWRGGSGSMNRFWEIVGSTEQRMQVSATRVRVPDLVVLLRPGPQPDIFD